MSSYSCIHCGETAAKSHDCCSSGCDLARRLPRGETDLPATWQLGVALAWGFLVFNQLLFAGMDLLALSKNETENAAKFAVLSLVAGAVVLLVNGFFFVISKPKLFSDWQVLAISAGIAFVGGYRLGEIFGEPQVLGFLLGNLLISAWLARGLFRGPASKKKQNF
ncbi:hypothetical protein [Pelagicoccus sp. SDUM812002]|uniref:hypothetical protein n=1 Tax=Pelagicoccus sp. SDUM812002 TaxID=3041266 RepID=UPI00280CB7B4|nr:hypothetical protein [Pelagicoccus sp. SDUM812002]MDQ8186661.1 hypothetical protein [Pelagicoccus sp. SDUM812002]